MNIASTTYTYALMERNGRYQWRYLDPAPPNENPGVSPEFPTLWEAIQWQESRTPLGMGSLQWTSVPLLPTVSLTRANPYLILALLLATLVIGFLAGRG